MQINSIEYLVNTPVEIILDNLENIFDNLIHEIKSNLKIDLVYPKIKVKKLDSKPLERLENFINFGVKKSYKNQILTISIYSDRSEFISIILLREAYKSFVPTILQENPLVNIIINQKVEIDLQKSPLIKEWKDIKREIIISYEFMKDEFDRIEGFLRQESKENCPSPFQFFFSYYVQNNVQLLEDYKNGFSGDKSFYDLFFEDYERRYNKYSEDILETIRIIAKIFYEVKNYQSLVDYQHYFKKYQEKGLFQTDISLRKFTESMQWIRDFSTIAPSYKINWPSLGVTSACCFLIFHPIIENAKIRKIINEFPFFVVPHISKNDFGINIFGYFILPTKYLKDLIRVLEKLEEDGYIIDNRLYLITNPITSINLNSFKSYKTRIINPKKQIYNREFELEHNFEYGDGKLKSPLTLLDWLLIDRIYGYSITSLGFEKKTEILTKIKEDLLNEIENQRKLIKDIKKILNEICNSPNLKSKTLALIENNMKYGFFYIKKMLDHYMSIFELIFNILSNQSSITNHSQFQELIKRQNISKTIEHNIIVDELNKNTIDQVTKSFFKSKAAFEEKVEDYHKISNLFNILYDLKIFNLEKIKSIVINEHLIQKIYQTKEEKLKHEFERYNTREITFKLIYHILDNFLLNDPPVLKAYLLNSLSIPRIKMYVSSILKDTIQSREMIDKIKWLFPRVLSSNISNYETHNKYIHLQFQGQYLNSKETHILFSILNDMFKKNILFIRIYYSSQSRPAFLLKDFYDLEQEDFFYTKDLFEQFYRYIQKSISISVNPIKKIASKNGNHYWRRKNISHLIRHVEYHVSKEHIDFNLKSLYQLVAFHKNLVDNLRDLETFKVIKKEYFFTNFIASIKFIPVFQRFGFGQYFFYFFPLELDEIDFKHFLHNSFQTIRYPTRIENSNSFLINFLWPYRNPNIKLLNWLTKSKKVIREYCVFFIKKIYQLFHFDYNLSEIGWDLDFNKFRMFFQKILYDPNYHIPDPKLKEINLGDLIDSDYFTPDSKEYKSLTELYNWRSSDLKSYLARRNKNLNNILELLNKNLIFPYISPKNLDLIKKIYIILPDVKKEQNEKLIKVFSFFNIGFIYEIEGEYFIYGFNEEIEFENGLMIKLYLPDCQLDEFEKLFDLIFEYLGIKHYLILNDLVDGKDLLKSIYGNLDFLKSYNPLKNLIWNKKDKIWMNQKLFDLEFNKIYPELIPKG